MPLAAYQSSLLVYFYTFTPVSTCKRDMGARDTTNMQSHIYGELRTRYFLKKASPIVLGLLLGFSLWMIQMVVALAYIPVTVNILH